MDSELRNQLETALYDRMKAENGEYLRHLKTLSPDEIIENAYQIAYRENILYIFEDETDLPEKRLRILLAQEKPLAMLYDDWCNRDVNEMSLLQEGVYTCTTGLLDQIADEKFSSPTVPMFAKSFENALADDELSEWKANQQRNEDCNKVFAEKAERAHAFGSLETFLREWTGTYGLERCMFVLSCTVAQGHGDGRYYPPARQAASRFQEQRELNKRFLRQCINSVHPGIVNLSMEILLRLEREQEQKSHKKRKATEKAR